LYYNQADFIPPAEKGISIPVWAIVAVVVVGVLVIFMVFGIAWWRRWRRQIDPLERGKHYEDTLTIKNSGILTHNWDFA
jgi:Tfp pilus assembly protein PilO